MRCLIGRKEFTFLTYVDFWYISFLIYSFASMSHTYKVVITDFVNDSLEIEKRILNNISDVIALHAFSEEQLQDNIEEADAIILYHLLTISKPTIDRLKNCKVIVRAG